MLGAIACGVRASWVGPGHHHVALRAETRARAAAAFVEAIAGLAQARQHGRTMQMAGAIAQRGVATAIGYAMSLCPSSILKEIAQLTQIKTQPLNQTAIRKLPYF